MKRFAVALALVLLTPALAAAHAVLPSAIEIALQPGVVDATLHLPAEQLGLALCHTWSDPSVEMLAAHPERFDAAFASRLRAYVSENLDLTDERGVRWVTTVGAPRWTTESDQPFVIVDVIFRAPDAHVPTAMRLHDDVVVPEEVRSHRTLVTVTRDFERADFAPRAEVLGMPRFGFRAVTIDREGASAMRGIAAMAELGARHIAEGLDHLLFLFVLLLPAALRTDATRRRWAGRRSVRETLRALLAIVTAFTIGHSTTLALGVLGLVMVPSRPVEVLVGASIGIGAVHAMRPLFAGREPLVAGLFGLVHGLAFASTLDGFGLRGSTLALALGAFNVGIELVQLWVVVAIAPLLALAARHTRYDGLRIACAGFALAASITWMAERVFGVGGPLAELLARAASDPVATGAAVWIALAAWIAVPAARRRWVAA